MRADSFIQRYLPLPIWHFLVLLGVLVVLWSYYHFSSQPNQKVAPTSRWFNKAVIVEQQPPVLLAMTKTAEEQWKQKTEQPSSEMLPVLDESVVAQKNVVTADNIPVDVASIPKSEDSIMQVVQQAEKKITGQRFTVQLLSGVNPAVVQSVIDQHPQIKSLRMLKSKRAGESRYLLLYGEFATRQAAEAAVLQIPSSIMQSKPWIRVMKDDL